MWVYLQAENNGDLTIEDVSCDVNVEVNGIPVGSKSVTFAGGGEIDPGDTVEETLIFYNINIVTFSNIKIEPTDIDAEPVQKGISCKHPLI